MTALSINTMKTNKNSHLNNGGHFNQSNNNAKNEVEKQSKPEFTSPKEQKLQKTLFEVANDEDFIEIFPKLKSVEKAYLRSQKGRSFVMTKLITILIVAAILTIIVFFSWNFLSFFQS